MIGVAGVTCQGGNCLAAANITSSIYNFGTLEIDVLSPINDTWYLYCTGGDTCIIQCVEKACETLAGECDGTCIVDCVDSDTSICSTNLTGFVEYVASESPTMHPTRPTAAPTAEPTDLLFSMFLKIILWLTHSI